MTDLIAEIKRHTTQVTRKPANRIRYRNTCPNCNGRDVLAPHGLRSRSLRYISDNRVLTVAHWLARWRCQSCRITFTDYPDFRTPL